MPRTPQNGPPRERIDSIIVRNHHAPFENGQIGVNDSIRQLLHRWQRPACGDAPSRLFRLAFSAWIVFAVAVSVKMVVSPVKHNSCAAFETGSLLWWAGLNMYELSYNEFRYGPAIAVAFSPLLVLPTAVGRLLWIWLNLAALGWVLRALVRRILPASWTADREGAFLLLVLALTYRGLWSAQCNTLLFALIVAGMLAIQRRNWGRAALWLAVPVHIKVWPVAAVLLLIACWPRQLAARFIIALLAIAAIPFLTQPPTVVCERYYDWYLALTGPMQVRHEYRDAWTIWELIQAPVDKLAYTLLQLSTALLVLALCLWHKRRGVTMPQLFTFILGAWAAWQLLFGPGTERNTFGLMAPLTAWAVVTCFSNSRGRVVTGTAFALTMMASIGQIERAVMPVFPWVQMAHPLGVAIFAGWLFAHARQWPAAAQEIEIDVTVSRRATGTPSRVMANVGS